MNKVQLNLYDLNIIFNLITRSLNEMETPYDYISFHDKRSQEEIDAEKQQIIEENKATDFYKGLRKIHDTFKQLPFKFECINNKLNSEEKREA